MDKRDFVLIWLSLQIAVMSYLWMKAEKKVSYYEGIQQVYDWQSEAANEACGPYEQPITKRGHK